MKWSYSGDTPGVFTETFTNAVANGTKVGVVYDVATEATISGSMTSDHGGFVKIGPGTLTLAGETEKDVTIDIRKGGKISQYLISLLGARHGFVNNTAPDKPALALLRIHPGGAIRITGGGTMLLFK